MSSNPPAVMARGVTKQYGDLVAVDNLDLTVHEGEVYGVLGPNGAGKTTFLRMLFGLIASDAGEIELFGRSIRRDGMRALDRVAGFIEAPGFYPYLSARRNLELFADLDGGGARARIDEMLDIVDLTKRAHDKVGGFSYGMRQRLGVAASLVRDPRLLVLDEPANGLDPAGIRDMRALVKRLGASGLTVLLSSHHMLEVEEICDNVTIMKAGTVAFHGSLHDLRSLAPAPGSYMHTNADSQALVICLEHPGISDARTDDGMLRFHGEQKAADSLVLRLAHEEIAVRWLTASGEPLETLFFMLTETDDASRRTASSQPATRMKETV